MWWIPWVSFLSPSTPTLGTQGTNSREPPKGIEKNKDQQKHNDNHNKACLLWPKVQEKRSHTKNLGGARNPAPQVGGPAGVHPQGKPCAAPVPTGKLASAPRAADPATESWTFSTSAPVLGPESHLVCLQGAVQTHLTSRPVVGSFAHLRKGQPRSPRMSQMPLYPQVPKRSLSACGA